jgi:pimeloyl-ACP methyl ester carboxylesterase
MVGPVLREEVRVSVLNRNNVRVLGRGSQPMLFAHGYGCDQTMWRFITPAFADDYRIVLFDHVGSGASDLSAYSRSKYSSLAGYADDVLEICSELELTNVVFVGHSVSAMIGVLAAINSLTDSHDLSSSAPHRVTSTKITMLAASRAKTSRSCSSSRTAIFSVGPASSRR